MTIFTAYIEFGEETQLYVGIVPGVPGAQTQAASLHVLRSNLQQVLELCLEEDGGLRDRLSKFVECRASPGRSAADVPDV